MDWIKWDLENIHGFTDFRTIFDDEDIMYVCRKNEIEFTRFAKGKRPMQYQLRVHFENKIYEVNIRDVYNAYDINDSIKKATDLLKQLIEASTDTSFINTIINYASDLDYYTNKYKHSDLEKMWLKYSTPSSFSTIKRCEEEYTRIALFKFDEQLQIIIKNRLQKLGFSFNSYHDFILFSKKYLYKIHDSKKETDYIILKYKREERLLAEVHKVEIDNSNPIQIKFNQIIS